MITLKKVTEDGTDHSCKATPVGRKYFKGVLYVLYGRYTITHEVTDRDLL